MTMDKLKSLIPVMEEMIQTSNKENVEMGFSFRTNDIAKIERVCSPGTSCKIIFSRIEKKEGTKIGDFHTHPRITAETARTTPIGGGFSCADILEQIDSEHNYGCTGTSDEIVCAELRSLPPSDVSSFLANCVGIQSNITEKMRELKSYKGSEEEKDDLNILDNIQKLADQKLRPYVNFAALKRLK